MININREALTDENFEKVAIQLGKIFKEFREKQKMDYLDISMFTKNPEWMVKAFEKGTYSHLSFKSILNMLKCVGLTFRLDIDPSLAENNEESEKK